LNTYGFSLALVPGSHLTILINEFITAKQASLLMSGENAGRPDTYLVCYVRVQDPFLLQNMSVPSGTKLKKSTAKFGEMVFDAHTGNELVWGIWG
jgi:hypothetical protein